MDIILSQTLKVGWPSAVMSPTKGPCLSQLQPDVSNYARLETSLSSKAGLYRALVGFWMNP